MPDIMKMISSHFDLFDLQGPLLADVTGFKAVCTHIKSRLH